MPETPQPVEAKRPVDYTPLLEQLKVQAMTEAISYQEYLRIVQTITGKAA